MDFSRRPWRPPSCSRPRRSRGPRLAAALAAPAASGPRHAGAGTKQDAYVLTLGKDSLSTNLDFDSYERMRQRALRRLPVVPAGRRRLPDRGSGDAARGAGALRSAPGARARAEGPEPPPGSALREGGGARSGAGRPRLGDRPPTEETGESGGDWDDEFSASDETEAAPPTDEERAEIDRELGELRNQQDALRPRQHELEAKNHELDAQERALDAREEKLERAAESRLWQLIGRRHPKRRGEAGRGALELGTG